MSELQTIVLGAGPAGLSAAYFALKAGKKVTIVERSKTIGGLNKTVEFLGEEFDLGPHSFYNNYSEEAKELFKEFIGQSYSLVDPVKLLQKDNVLFHNPIKTTDLAHPPTSFFLVRSGISKMLSNNKEQKNLFNAKYGNWLNEHIFAPYCIKYFGLEQQNVSTKFAASLYTNRKDNLADQIYLPANGNISSLWTNLGHYLYANGVTFEFESEATRLEYNDEGIITKVFTTKSELECENLVATIPLFGLIKLLPRAEQIKTSKLKYRSTILVFMQVESIKTKALYLTDYSLDSPIGRITFHKNWKKSSNRNVISVEFWCNTTDEIWKLSDDAIIGKINEHLFSNLYFTLKADPSFKIYRIDQCFPILETGYEEQLAILKEETGKLKNLHLIGRHGNFQWDGIDDSILQAKRVFNS